MAPSVTTLAWKEQKRDARIWCRSRFPATLMTGARARSCGEASWRGDKRLSTQMMCSPWRPVIICPFLPLAALFIFVLKPPLVGFFTPTLNGWAKVTAGQGRNLPWTTAPVCQFACISSVSTNAFRLDSTCVFSFSLFFFFLQAPVEPQHQQIVIESNLVLKDDLDIWVHQENTGNVSVYNTILDDYLTNCQPPCAHQATLLANVSTVCGEDNSLWSTELECGTTWDLTEDVVAAGAAGLSLIHFKMTFMRFIALSS